MAFVLFEKPAGPERIPANRDNSPALRFDFVLDPAFVNEMHDDANRQAGTNDKEINVVAIHTKVGANCRPPCFRLERIVKQKVRSEVFVAPSKSHRQSLRKGRPGTGKLQKQRSNARASRRKGIGWPAGDGE